MSTQLPPSYISASGDRYGSIVGNQTPERNVRAGRIVKYIVAKDGQVSDAEMTAFLDLAAIFGMTQAHVDDFVAFDPSTCTLEELLEGFSDDALSRRMIYESIRISAVDGNAAAERAAVAEAARILGVDAGVVALLEGIVETDLAIGRMRASLLGNR